jgi:hypothetical protein
MKKEELIQKAYEIAVERYAAVGVDTEKVLKTMQDFHLSLHCWQADDVAGFEVQAGSLTGGIQATGNYPGKARNIDELRADILKAASYIPGTHRLNLHEIYGDFQGKVVDRDQVEPEHFKSWIEWGKEHNMKLDFNSTSFSHPKSGDLSLSNPDEGIRQFWIEHTKRCRAVAEEMGKAQGDPCIMNLWVHDGSKDITVNRMKYRALLKDSLDQIFATEYKNMKDCIESKVFGIGLESYTVGSNDFYIGYGASRNKMITLDTGHFHPTESVADKVLDYNPAPSQYMNTVTTAYKENYTAEEVRKYAEEQLKDTDLCLISLGAYGGYITVGFDHTVPNVPGEYDLKIYGNAYYDMFGTLTGALGGSAEPGIVLVSKDTNGNGLADDEWYELAGSEYNSPATTKNYTITYYRPSSPKEDVKWTDNKGNEGYVYRNDYHTTNSYYPAWIKEDQITFHGSRLKDNTVNEPHENMPEHWVGYCYAWGYADNHPNGEEQCKFKIDWAVDKNGNPVVLDGIDFVRIYTAVNQNSGWMGEISTELQAVEDLHFKK